MRGDQRDAAGFVVAETGAEPTSEISIEREAFAPLTFWCDGNQVIAHRGGHRQVLGPRATEMLLDVLRRDWAA